jgi:hypothetical protein
MASDEVKVPEELAKGGSDLVDLGAEITRLVQAHQAALANIKFVTGGNVEDKLTAQFKQNYLPDPIIGGVEEIGKATGALGDNVEDAAKNYQASETNAATVAATVQDTGN